LGFGFDGARDALVKGTSWGAGNAHNSLLELILAGGLPATVVFIFGWASSARHAWISRSWLRLRALGIYGYIAAFGMSASNLTYLQYLAVFLIITLDSKLYAEFMVVRSHKAELVNYGNGDERRSLVEFE
jgi:hypothetical protein